jgi:hypothetical protein
MKNLRYSIILLLLLVGFAGSSFAQQTDSRNRVTSTIIADGLAQLPAKNIGTFNQVMSEMAATGHEGIEMIADMLKPATEGKNAVFEYAINGIVDYSLQPGNEKLRNGVNEGITNAIEKCTDNPNKAFLMTQLQKFGDKKNVGTFEKYLSDKYLMEFALRGLAATNGIDDEVISLMKAEKAPRTELAYLAKFKKIKAAEPILLSWLDGTDEKTKKQLYEDIAVCGGNASVKTLQKAAKAAGFAPDPTRATDAYIQLLTNLDDAKTVNKLSRELLKSNDASVRCSGLNLMLKNDGKNLVADVMKALKSNDIEYRNTALTCATEQLGDGSFTKIADGIKSLPVDAQIDVVRWLGNNHVSECTPTVIAALQSPDSVLVKAAIESASKIGGNDNLKALISMLGGNYYQNAYGALKSFKGNISNEILNALNSDNSNECECALGLASERHIHSAYNKVKELTGSSNGVTQALAYTALKGVSTSENFDELCNMMEQGNHITSLQNAAKASIFALSAGQQYEKIAAKMKNSQKASLYYPLLAQAGNTEAINELKEAYTNGTDKEAAYKSLLDVSNPQVTSVLYDIAKNDAAKKDEVLKRYVSLVKGSEANAETTKYYSGNDAKSIQDNNVVNFVKKYQAYRQALELNPADKVVNTILSNLSECRTMPSLMLASKYLDNKATAYEAALTIKDIVAKNEDLQSGELVKGILKKAQDVCRAQKGDADAGYAVDEINGLLQKFSADGYETIISTPGMNTEKARIIAKDVYENFELYMEWKTDGEGKLNLRSMPLVDLKPVTGEEGNWNTLYCKVIDDRMFVESNGVKVRENQTMVNTPATKPITTSGIISVVATKGIIDVRDMYVKKLPSTPVFTLSPEEKKAGYEVLFDGRSLDKWQGNTAAYVPTDGNIYVTAQYGGTGNLYTKKKYKNFIYRFEFCFAVPGVNNGIGVRTNIGTDAAYDGMEIQVLDHDDPIYKDLHPYQQHGSVYGIIVPKHIKFGPLGTWNQEEIQVIGDHVKVTVNGQVLTDGNIREACQGHNVAPDGSNVNPYTVDHKNHPGLFNKEGYISFCGHGAGVKFRNVRILDLSNKTNKKK